MGSDRVSGIALVALALGVGWQSLRLPLGSLRDPGPGYLPLALAGLLAGLGLLVATRRTPPLGDIAWGGGRHALSLLLACAVWAGLLEPLGWRLSSLAVLVFVLGVMERQRWWVVLALSLVLSFGSYHLFYDLLKVPLPPGPRLF
jgi:hypothetical protein